METNFFPAKPANVNRNRNIPNKNLTQAKRKQANKRLFNKFPDNPKQKLKKSIQKLQEPSHKVKKRKLKPINYEKNVKQCLENTPSCKEKKMKH